MEAMSSDSGSGPSLPWSYRGDQIRSNNPYDNSVTSSSSGTIVSTAYTSSSGSRLSSSSISMDAVRHFELALDEDTELVRPAKKSCKGRERMKHMDIESIVQEHFFRVPSVELISNINRNSGRMSVLERWFSELGVAWVLHLPADGASAGKLEHTSAVSWIHGLSRILQTICGSKVLVRGSLGQVSDSDKQASDVQDQIRLALFTKEAMFRAEVATVAQLVGRMQDEADLWAAAGFRHLNCILARR